MPPRQKQNYGKRRMIVRAIEDPTEDYLLVAGLHLEASQRNVNTITTAKCVGWYRFIHTYRYVMDCLNLEHMYFICILWTVMYVPVMTFIKSKLQCY